MNEYQYTNPFYEDGYLSGINDEPPYDPSKYTEQRDIENEMYRLHEWIAGNVRGYTDDVTKEVVQSLQKEADKDLINEEWTLVDGLLNRRFK